MYKVHLYTKQLVILKIDLELRYVCSTFFVRQEVMMSIIKACRI